MYTLDSRAIFLFAGFSRRNNKLFRREKPAKINIALGSRVRCVYLVFSNFPSVSTWHFSWWNLSNHLFDHSYVLRSDCVASVLHPLKLLAEIFLCHPQIRNRHNLQYVICHLCKWKTVVGTESDYFVFYHKGTHFIQVQISPQPPSRVKIFIYLLFINYFQQSFLGNEVDLSHDYIGSSQFISLNFSYVSVLFLCQYVSLSVCYWVILWADVFWAVI